MPLKIPVNMIYSNTGYPKLVSNNYVYRPHNAYRNTLKILWYCAGRNKFKCNAKLRTYNQEVIGSWGTHNHEPS
ncbi:Uncharacterized protein OBRU01_16090 [Operophtera brumata]|uniref:FLYWCH-type domain-containing protein n=1 Tax=Operophtera brumata TaxID=104452 RepID=A0A0L7L3Q8_OPEBR|nr:Uncharacterized protein OBRU01_16090 [Operophtera brumata]